MRKNTDDMTLQPADARLSSSLAHEHSADFRSLRCPVLSHHVRRRLGLCQPGDTLTLICADPLSVIDIPWLIIDLNDELIAQEVDQATITFVIRKRAQPPRPPVSDVMS